MCVHIGNIYMQQPNSHISIKQNSNKNIIKNSYTIFPHPQMCPSLSTPYYLAS